VIAALPFEIDLVVRLLVAAVLGAGVGLERELHGHPAGMRTHLLVSLGSGLFTIVSIYGFVGLLAPSVQAPVDPSRVAAQIVSGIGFLGAGAILKDGFTIRGLTTAASLWATAAIGMAAGAGQMLLAIVGTAIVVVSLWPLNAVAERLHGMFRQRGRIRVLVDGPDSLERVRATLERRPVAITGVTTERVTDGLAAEFGIDAQEADLVRLSAELAEVEGVSTIETGQQD
jgi:putative Mg2+ transporter-C (MgtC) family protein